MPLNQGEWGHVCLRTFWLRFHPYLAPVEDHSGCWAPLASFTLLLHSLVRSELTEGVLHDRGYEPFS